MRLSEALMLGVPELRRFGNSDWYYRRLNGDCDGCLVGAALYAVGAKSGPPALDSFAERWPWTESTKITPTVCPVCQKTASFRGLPSTLTCLVNHYKEKEITLEQICDWVRSIEPNEPEESTPIRSSQPQRQVSDRTELLAELTSQPVV